MYGIILDHDKLGGEQDSINNVSKSSSFLVQRSQKENNIEVQYKNQPIGLGLFNIEKFNISPNGLPHKGSVNVSTKCNSIMEIPFEINALSAHRVPELVEEFATNAREKGINVIHDLKGVGRNLQDHLETYIQQECRTSDTLYSYTKLLPKIFAGVQWFLSKSGPCSQSYLEAGGFAKSSPERKIPNIQFHFFPSFVINHGLVNPSSHGYQLHASPNHPKSRGLITLNSSNPYDYPKILFNYLEDEDDLKQTRECIHVARKILSQPSLAKHAGKEIGPGSDKQSDEELNEYIKANAETAYHPCGTCKMGVDEASVVDENLKVKGIKNLRVVDASVMPEIPSANLNAPTLMIAEKAADLILN